MQQQVGEAIQSRYRHTTPYYDVVILASPVRIESLAIDPSGRGRHFGVINNFGRMGSGIYASYGSFSQREPHVVMGGRPERVQLSESSLRLEDIPVGDRGLKAHWTFTFADTTFDIALEWLVEQHQTDLWEAGWKLDGLARSISDPNARNLTQRRRGSYVSPSRAYLAWSEEDPRYAHTLVAAFVPGSADRGDGYFVEPALWRPVTSGFWATVLCEGGTRLEPGSLRGGTWRIGASGKAHDHTYAEALASEVAGGPAAVPAPGVAHELSDGDAARSFAKLLDPPHSGGLAGTGLNPQVRKGPQGSWLLTDASVRVAFVPDGSFYKCWFYVASQGEWQWVATAGPTRRITWVAAGDDGTLWVEAEGIGPDGTVQTTSKERWRIRTDTPALPPEASSTLQAAASGVIHIVSTDTPTAGHTAHPMHSYLAYPQQKTKHEVDSYDVLASPLLRPQADLVIGQRPLWSPALQVQQGDVSVALVPDLLFHRQPGKFGRMPGRRYMGLTLDLDVANKMVDAPQLSFGWRTTEGVYGYYYRDLGKTPRQPVELAYNLVLRAGAPEHSVVSDVQWRLWEQVGKRYFEQSRLPQTQSADRAFDEAWSHWAPMYDERVVEGERRGGVRIDREFPPDIMFMSWFNALRSSYGLYTLGRDRDDAELMAQGRATLDLLLSAPQESGAFPTVVGLREGGFEWYASQKNFLDQMPWGPTSYATFDMGWAAYWVLRWYQDLLPEPLALEFARSYGEFLLAQQLPSGALPSWIAQGTLKIQPYLRESAQTASSVMFLGELARVTQDPRYLEAAQKAGRYVIEHHLQAQRWDDFEPYYSNSLKAEGASDPFSGQSTQNTLSMHFAALGLLTLYELTDDAFWLTWGQRAVDTYLQYQYVLPGLGLSLNAYGGFAVQNTDNEAVDARQSQFGLTLLDYARHTGRGDYAQRGIVAIRAGYATMASPSAEVLNPMYFDAYPVGRGPENYAHATHDGPAGYTAFDWGQGSAAAGFAEARNRFGDVWVDARRHVAYGIDHVHAASLQLSGGQLALALHSPAAGHRVLLKVEGLEDPQIRLQINGEQLGTFTREELEKGVRVPTRQDLRIVHNPFRTGTAVAGQPFRVSARMEHEQPVQQAQLHFRTGDGAWHTVPMRHQEANMWVGVVPASHMQSGRALEYYFTARAGTATGVAPEVDPQEVPFHQMPVPAHIVETGAYRAIVGTGKAARLLSLEVDPKRTGQYRQVLGHGWRGVAPYAAIGGFGDTDRAGAPQEVFIAPDGREVRLLGIPIGDEPITVDWIFRFHDDTFDVAFDWNVHGPTRAPLWEIAWTWETLLGHMGDEQSLSRGTGDVSGFGDWVMAYGDDLSLVIAFQAGSAWSTANRYFHGSAVVWQSLWQPRGRTLSPGHYPGGVWRIGASPKPADADFAKGLHSELNG